MLVEAVRVDAGLRGNGLGSAMMAWAVEEGRRHGASMVQLTSDKARGAAHRFYERQGSRRRTSASSFSSNGFPTPVSPDLH
nr:GNAT family N-acetyltransferase [Arthrobacter gengyunqii]